ncbi:MAG: anthranilate phosphoribosyltransferase [Abditibacteriaceae bacterium]
MILKDALQQVTSGGLLTRKEAEKTMGLMMDGGTSDLQVAALLGALRMRGETLDEIVGFVAAMRERCIPVTPKSLPLVDTCGTGGDSSGIRCSTFNVSTAAAFIAAGAGARIAKHGNRASSSRCGSADVLEELNVRLDLTPEQVAQCVDEIGLGFMFAPAHHPAMKNVAHIRKELSIRTVFNLLGPLVNPANAKRQVMGVSDARWIMPIAQVLQALGTEHAIVAHSRDGMDEFSTCAPTEYAEVKDGQIVEKVLFPHEYDYHCVDELFLAGGDAAQNATVIWDILTHGSGAPADIACLNAGAALVVSGIAEDFSDGMKLAKESLKSGAAHKKLKQLVDFVEEMKS